MMSVGNEKQESRDYKILVVDDSSAHLKLLESWLEESGFDVVAAADGFEAIIKFNGDLFDLVLTNVKMPGINGNILAQYIHAINKDIPVVAITATPFYADCQFDLVIRKPYELEGLVTSLQYALNKLPGHAVELNNSKRQLLRQLEGLGYGH